jgi:8-oxo-dGTP pyrophosphatase MutT (NUDIX family)
VLAEVAIASAIVALCALALRALGWPVRERPLPPAKWSSAGGIVENARGEVAIVLQKKRRVLRWTLPKGRIDAGETAETAALREVYEETGLRARIVRPLGVHEGPRHFTHYFEMLLISDDGSHDDETKEVRFVSLAEAARNVRSRRDLKVLRRLMELRTRVVGH